MKDKQASEEHYTIVGTQFRYVPPHIVTKGYLKSSENKYADTWGRKEKII